jgi:hypothetical protein
VTGTERTDRTALPLAEAAGRLGLTSDALRMRIRRGRVQGFKRDGHVFVYLDGPPDPDVRSSVRPEQTSRRDRRTTEQARRTEAPNSQQSLAVVVEFQKVELDRLLRDNERLNRRLDQQSQDSRKILEMLQREQVLRQQEQGLRQQIQGVVESLSDRLALSGPAATESNGRAARAGGAGDSPETPEAAAEPAESEPRPGPEPQPGTSPRLDERVGEIAARRFQTEAAVDAPASGRPGPAAGPIDDLSGARRTAAPSPAPSPAPPPAPDRRTQELGELLKEIGQSLRDLERGDDPPRGPPARAHAAAGGSGAPGPGAQAATAPPVGVPAEDRVALDDILNQVPLDEDRRKAARILRRLFRNRNEPGPGGK